MNQNQYATRWLKDQEPKILIQPLQIKAVVARRAALEEWKDRDKKATHLPKGTVVVEVNADSFQRYAQLQVQELVDAGVANAFLVVGHSKTDARPQCELIGGDGIVADLPLLPIPLIDLVINATEDRAVVPPSESEGIPIVYDTNW